MKSLADTKEFKAVLKRIEASLKNPAYVKALDEFIRYHTGKSPR